MKTMSIFLIGLLSVYSFIQGSEQTPPNPSKSYYARMFEQRFQRQQQKQRQQQLLLISNPYPILAFYHTHMQVWYYVNNQVIPSSSQSLQLARPQSFVTFGEQLQLSRYNIFT